MNEENCTFIFTFLSLIFILMKPVYHFPSCFFLMLMLELGFSKNVHVHLSVWGSLGPYGSWAGRGGTRAGFDPAPSAWGS